ncbi:hypothetical protein [Bifidobacterium sp. ESL0825]|uniref:hypothetical protein n=1 Tax=Bifidobacterium sp. ESL0825 TaxID=3448587 RepID=UPI0040426A93
MDGDLLLAVDRQGQVHAYQASRKDGQNTNPKFLEQATTGLPGQAQAVTAAASGGRALALDADGQAWAWDASKTGNVKPARIKQDTQIRIVQAQALNQGFLLLDADGQAWHQADGTTSLTAVELPENLKASRITTNNDQGHHQQGRPPLGLEARRSARPGGRREPGLHAGHSCRQQDHRHQQAGRHVHLEPGRAGPARPAGPARHHRRAHPGNSRHGRPAAQTQQDTGDAWQTDIPARQPGPAAITITGRQDDQPFTRNLTYTVDQTLTRDNRQGSAYTVRFDTGGGNPTPQDQSIQPVYGRVQRPPPTRRAQATCSTDGSPGRSPTTSANPSPKTSPSPPTGPSKTPTAHGASAPTRAASSARKPPPSPRQTPAEASDSTRSAHQKGVVFPWLWAATATPTPGDATTAANSATGQPRSPIPPSRLRRSK